MEIDKKGPLADFQISYLVLQILLFGLYVRVFDRGELVALHRGVRVLIDTDTQKASSTFNEVEFLEVLPATNSRSDAHDFRNAFDILLRNHRRSRLQRDLTVTDCLCFQNAEKEEHN